MRNFTDFMIWNHIFFIIEIFHAYYKKDYTLVFLVSSTTYLSIERHRTMYTKYNMIEPIHVSIALNAGIYLNYLN